MKSLGWACFLFAVMCQISAGSRITFQANPADIFAAVTNKLNLRCAVTRTTPGDGSYNTARTTQQSFSPYTTWPWYYTTARPQTSPITWPWYYTTARPQTSTSIISNPSIPNTDVAHIISIIIFRQDTTGVQQKIASVSTFDPPLASADSANIQVVGQTVSSSIANELGYLEVTWDHPSSTQSGLYTCEVSAVDSFFHAVTLSQNVQIRASEPTVADLTSIIVQYDKIISAMNRTLTDLASQTSALQLHSQQQLETTRNLSLILQDKTGPASPQNTQSGPVICNTATIFQKSYNRPPTVLATFSQLQYSGSSGTLAVNIQNLTLYGFTPSCTSSGFYNYFLTWVAIGN